MRAVIRALKPIVVGLMIMLGIGSLVTILLYLLGFATNWLFDRRRAFTYLDSGPSFLGKIALGFETVTALIILAGVLTALYRIGKQLTKELNKTSD
jgi:hypothetical protein